MRLNKVAKTVASFNCSINDIYVYEDEDEWYETVQLFKDRFSAEINLTNIPKKFYLNF